MSAMDTDPHSLLCRTQSLEQAAAHARCKTKRNRRGVGVTETSEPVAQAVLEEAAALMHLRTGVCCSGGRPNMDAVQKLLQDDRAGVSNCGECDRCKRGVDCVHASNVRAAVKGKTGARWAAQGAGLVGKTFEVRGRLQHRVP